LTHELQFVKIGNNEEKLKKVLNETAAYLNSIQLKSLEWENFSTKLFASISDAGKFNKIADELIKMCERELINGAVTEETKPERKHKILVLEDDPDFQKVIEENLKSHFEELLITGSAEKAIEQLQDNGTNDITGIISDWRLYADPKEKTYWQLQGYEVLDYAAKNRLIALFALTSLSDRNVHNIRNTLGLDIHLFKKQHLETADSKVQWEMMADTVKQKCDAILEVISSQPTGEAWKNLKNEYIIRRGAGWSSFENEINQEASRIFNYYVNAINADETRNVYSISELGVVLKNNLKSILIARRVYLGIYFTLVKTNNYLQDVNGNYLGDGNNIDTELKHHSIDTHSLIRKDWWDDISGGLDSTKIEEAWSKLEQRMKNLRGTLCIELTELPTKGILPEEKFWLSKNNIDFSFLFNYWQLVE
jgi:CheY-like chemotaxis protein